MRQSILFFLLAIVVASTTLAGERREAYKLKFDGVSGPVEISLDSEAMGFTLSDLEVGDSRTTVTANGDPITVTRLDDNYALDYAGERFDFALNGRWVDEFRWITGPFVGDVASYVTFDLSAGYLLNERVKLGASVANVFAEEHWENFGGDLIGRRALGYLTLTW